MKKLFVAASALLAMNVANAEQYVGAGLLHMDGDDIGITSFAATYDYKFNPNIGVQLGLATGGDDDVRVPPVGSVNIELDYAVTAKLKAGIPTWAGFLYGTLGYSTVNLEAKALGVTLSEDGNGAVAGFGADFILSNEWGVGFEYTRGFSDIEDTNLFQAVVQYKF